MLKKQPLRTCVVTKEKLDKRDLIRVVRTPENQVIIDESGKANGRGAYLKNNLVVIEKAKNSKVLNHHLKIDVPNSIYEELVKNCNEGKVDDK